ncbi:CoaE-domain-containing protein [Atractiella rhizophila]|nr:CoaE-domain-containing protein [Atractiella rhizophila]
MLVVGLTGGIASGKSSVSYILHSHDIPIIDLDVLAREAVLPNTSAYRRIVKHFGSPVVDSTTTPPSLNREALGAIVFKDEKERKILNRIVHPAVRRLLFWKIIKHWITGSKIVVVDAPLLIEAGLWRLCGSIVLVYTTPPLQLSRLLSRNPHLSEQQAKERIAAQMPLDEKRKWADWTVENVGTREELEEQVKDVLERLSAHIGGVGWALCWLIPPVGVVWALVKVGYRLGWKRVGRKKKVE